MTRENEQESSQAQMETTGDSIDSRTASTVAPSAHTPGPWQLATVKTSIGVCHKVGPFPGNRVHPVTYACVYEDGMHLWRIMDRMDSELLANAHLIAAAPDLLVALKELVSSMEPYETDTFANCERARAAIARAEGRRP